MKDWNIICKTLKCGLFCMSAAIACAFSCACASAGTEDDEDCVPEFEISDIEPAPLRERGFPDDGHFLMAWNILGPLKAESADAFQTESVPGEKELNGSRRAPKGARWHVIRFSADGEDEVVGVCDFSGRITGNAARKSIFYACATLKADSRMENMVLGTGSCGKLRVWINGIPVFCYGGERRACRPDTDSVAGITLREGLNRIVVKYMDNDGACADERKFSLRFTDAQGRPTRIR